MFKDVMSQTIAGVTPGTEDPTGGKRKANRSRRFGRVY